MKKINDPNLNTVAKRIRYARHNKGITMQELADSIGKLYQTVQQYEKGIRNPKQKMIEEIAKGLDTSPIFIKNGGYELNEDKNAIQINVCIDKKTLEKEEDSMYSASCGYYENEEIAYDVNADCVIITELIRRINNSNHPEYIKLIRKTCDLLMKSVDKNYNEGIISMGFNIDDKIFMKRRRKNN